MSKSFRVSLVSAGVVAMMLGLSQVACGTIDYF